MSYNVNRNVDDVFYRYKMPRLQAKVEGKGNGIKTVIANMPDIAKALNRPPAYATKYFGCELGAQTQIDLKNDRYIVNGDHDQVKLQDTLDGFIKRFVLCQSCENPETTLKVRGKTQISQTCKACGHIGYIDMKHKLTAFIQKNPPAANDNADSSAGQKKVVAEDDGNGSGGDLEKNGGSESAEEEEWRPEVEGEAEVLTDRMKALIVHADLDKSVDDRLDMFYTWLQEHKQAQKGAELDGKAIADEAHRLDVKDKATLLLAGVLYGVDSFVADIAKYRSVMLRFTHGNHKAQKYLLGGVEQKIVTVPNKKAALIKQTPLILKALYDQDVVEEEVLLAWGKKPSKKYVSKEDSKAIIEAAAPLLTWLAEAEEETDEESDAEVEFDSSTASGARGAVVNGAAKVTNGHVSEEEDGVNIDDI